MVKEMGSHLLLPVSDMETPSSSTHHKEDNHACLHTLDREHMMDKMVALADLS